MLKQETIDWLKSTILGIIILGTLGSILAAIILRLLWHLLILIKNAIGGIFMTYLKPYVRSKMLTIKYSNRDDKSHLIMFAIMSFASLAFTALLLVIFCLATLLCFYFVGFHYPWRLVLFAILDMLTLWAVLTDLVVVIGIVEVVFYEDIIQANKLLSTKERVISALNKIAEDKSKRKAEKTITERSGLL